jgi:hypothetical protein
MEEYFSRNTCDGMCRFTRRKFPGMGEPPPYPLKKTLRTDWQKTLDYLVN